MIAALVVLLSASVYGMRVRVHEEPASECLDELIAQTEHALVQDMPYAAAEALEVRSVLSSDESSDEEKHRATERKFALDLVTHLSRTNLHNMIEAQREACHERQRATNDPCVHISYNRHSRQCVVRRLVSSECAEVMRIAERRRRDAEQVWLWYQWD